MYEQRSRWRTARIMFYVAENQPESFLTPLAAAVSRLLGGSAPAGSVDREKSGRWWMDPLRDFLAFLKSIRKSRTVDVMILTNQ